MSKINASFAKMRRMYLSSAVGLFSAIAIAAHAQSYEQRLRADLAFLTSTPLAGRLSLTPQADIAALYIAAEFQKAGLRPAYGDTFLQQFPLVAYRSDAAARRLAVTHDGHTTQFQGGADFSGSFYREAHVEAPLAFVGYGITAPEYHYDDYADIDVKGSIVVMFDHEPQEDDPNSVFAGTGQTVHWGRVPKMRNAQRHGALAVLIAAEPLRKHGALVGTAARGPVQNGQPLRASAPPQSLDDPTQIPVFSIGDATLAELLAASGRSSADLQRAIEAKLQPQSRKLADTTVRLDTANAAERRGTSLNVVGVLEGSDPALASDTVMLTAHYDHLGVVNGHLYPGANDNASGTAAVIELARRMAAGPRPKRTVMFAVFGSEEELMLGSFYYAMHPLRPLNRTRAVLNLDMIGRNEAHIPQSPWQGGIAPLAQQPARINWELRSSDFPESQGAIEIAADTSNNINLVGGGYSPDLVASIRHANRSIGLNLETKFDRDHVLNTLYRCDHLPFLLAGVPAVWLFGGFHPGYHEPSDTMDLLNYPKILKVIELAQRAASELADGTAPPRFSPAH